MSCVGVLGAGSWGTALAVQFAANGHQVRLWTRRPELCAELAAARSNAVYLPGIQFPATLEATHQLADLASCEVVLVVVPSHGFRQVVREFLAVVGDGPLPILVSGTKGVEESSMLRMSQVCAAEAAEMGRQVHFAVLGGPTFAAELARGVPSAGVIAGAEEEVAEHLRELLAARNFRLYSSADVVGVELAGTTKNVIAISAGVLLGLGLGQNTLAALITRGLHEITRLGVACGGQVATFYGLAGLGDLVLTCTGGLSRNRQVGIKLAEGLSLDQITGATPMVAEGVRNALTVSALARDQGVEMPITEQMVAVLYHGQTPRQALEELMTRQLKAETEP